MATDHDVTSLSRRNLDKKKRIKRGLELDLNMLQRLLKYSGKYQISIQFWPDQTCVFVAKDDVDLESWGASDDKNFAIKSAVEYLNNITPKKKRS